jgi:putative hydrolase of the HAD superfamily
MIKAIIFDAGEVLLSADRAGFIRNACRILRCNTADYEDFLAGHPMDPGLMDGTVDFHEALEKYFGRKITKKEVKMLERYWLNTWKPYPRMMWLVRKLKKSYKLAVLSNSDPVYAAMYKETGLWKDFDAIVLSSEIGIVKPDPRIYRFACKALGVRPKECLFIDDLARYVAGARSIGMDTIQFRSFAQLQRELARRAIHG